VCTDRLRLEHTAGWRLVGRHDNRLLSGLCARSVCRDRPPASQYDGTALQHATCTVDPTRLRTLQYLLDGLVVALDLDSLRRLDDIR